MANNFSRTPADLGKVDEDGYFFMVRSLEANGSMRPGSKVWPSEVEVADVRASAVLEACVIRTRDPHRWRDRQGARGAATRMARGRVDGRVLIEWCRGNHGGVQGAGGVIAFVDTFARESGSGKIQVGESFRIRRSQAVRSDSPHLRTLFSRPAGRMPKSSVKRRVARLLWPPRMYCGIRVTYHFQRPCARRRR